MATDTCAAVFFDRFADRFDTIYDYQRGPFMRWFDQQFRSDMVVRFDRTFSSFGDITGKTVLDIGCGSGPYITEALRRKVSFVTGVDPAPEMLRIVRQRLDGTAFSSACDLIEGGFPAVDLEPHDHVIVMGVLDYVRDAERFISALRPLTRRSAAVSFPSKHWLRTPLRRFRYWIRKCPVYFHDEAQIRVICEQAGFSRIDVFKIPGAGQDYHVCLTP